MYTYGYQSVQTHQSDSKFNFRVKFNLILIMYLKSDDSRVNKNATKMGNKNRYMCMYMLNKKGRSDTNPSLNCVFKNINKWRVLSLRSKFMSKRCASFHLNHVTFKILIFLATKQVITIS